MITETVDVGLSAVDSGRGLVVGHRKQTGRWDQAAAGTRCEPDRDNHRSMAAEVVAEKVEAVADAGETQSAEEKGDDETAAEWPATVPGRDWRQTLRLGVPVRAAVSNWRRDPHWPNDVPNLHRPTCLDAIGAAVEVSEVAGWVVEIVGTAHDTAGAEVEADIVVVVPGRMADVAEPLVADTVFGVGPVDEAEYDTVAVVEDVQTPFAAATEEVVAPDDVAGVVPGSLGGHLD